MSERPFDDIRNLLRDLPAAATVPANRGDHFAEMAGWIAAWRGRAEVNRPILVLYAGAHQGGTGEDARARLEAIASGEAAVAKAAGHLGAGLDVFDLAIERPTPDIAEGPSMGERECAATMAFGMEALAKQPDLLLLSAFGPGADEAGEALLAALTGAQTRSDRVATAATRAKAEAGGDPLELLRQLGGRECAALAGGILAARTQSVPVLLGGPSALAAAAVLAALDPAAVAHCRLAGAQAAARAAGVVAIGGFEPPEDGGLAAYAALALVRLACAAAG